MAHAPAPVAQYDETIPPAMDYKEHEKTYKGFLSVTKWSIIIMAVVVVLLYFIIQP